MVQDNAMNVLLMAEPCLQPVLTNTVVGKRQEGGEEGIEEVTQVRDVATSPVQPVPVLPGVRNWLVSEWVL